MPAPVDLSKLSHVVKNDFIKKMYIMLRSKIKDKILHITNLAINTTLNAKINGVKKEIPSITNLAATAALDAKINYFKSKTPNISNFATTTALTAVECKVTDHSVDSR